MLKSWNLARMFPLLPFLLFSRSTCSLKLSKQLSWKEMDQQAQCYCRAYMHVGNKTWSYFCIEGNFLKISLDLQWKSKRVKLS